MAGYSGADPDQLRALARTFDQTASRLDGIGREVSGRLSGTSWSGPDAERYRSQWHGESMATIRRVVSALQEASTSLKRNAAEQESASSAGGAAGATGLSGSARGGAVTEVNPLVDARNWLGGSTFWPIQNSLLLADTPLAKYVPLVDALGLAADTSMDPKEKMIDASGSLVDLGGGLLRGASKTNPVTYLSGVAVSQWGDVATNIAKADFSASTLKTTGDFITSNPGEAFGAAADAVAGYIPKLISNWF